MGEKTKTVEALAKQFQDQIERIITGRKVRTIFKKQAIREKNRRFFFVNNISFEPVLGLVGTIK